MKKVMIAFFMVLTMNVFSADISIKTNNSNDIVIRVNTVNENENIKIYDENGDVLFFEQIDRRNYLKIFNLKTLPKGLYFVEYENDNEISTAIVEKQKDVVVSTDFNEITFKPIISQKGDFTSVGFTNPKREKVDIIIKDNNGFELVDIQNMNDLFIKKTFDTGRLPKGDYTVKVKTNSNSFIKNITIK